MARPGNATGASPRQAQHGAKPAGETKPGERLDSFDISDELKGDNDLQANDQARTPSERHAQAGATGDTDELLESFKKIDKRYRSRADDLKRKP